MATHAQVLPRCRTDTVLTGSERRFPMNASVRIIDRMCRRSGSRGELGSILAPVSLRVGEENYARGYPKNYVGRGAPVVFRASCYVLLLSSVMGHQNENAGAA